MARLFDGVDDLLTTDTPPVTAVPFSWACWIKPDDVTNNYEVLALVLASGTTTHRFALKCLGGTANDPLYFSAAAAGLGQDAAINGIVAGVWQHIAGVAASATSRLPYLNGAAGTVNAVSTVPVGIDRFSVGVANDAAVGTSFAGLIAEVSVWNAALTAAEVLRLARGTQSRFVRPGSLVGYWPLHGRHSPENDLAGSNSLTVTEAAANKDHPKIILPNARRRRRGAMIGA